MFLQKKSDMLTTDVGTFSIIGDIFAAFFTDFPIET